MTDVLRKLIEVEKLSAESHRLRGGLIERSVMDDERINILEAMLREAQDVALRAERKYAEATQQYIIHEELLGETDKVTENLEKKLCELEKDKAIASNKLTYMKTMNDKSANGEKALKDQIKALGSSIEKSKLRALHAQEDTLKHQKEICLISDEFLAIREKRGLLRAEMERMASGVQDL
jgi:tropomyosin 1